MAAATLRLLDRLRELDTDPAGKLAALVEYLSSEDAANQDPTFTATLLGTADLLQVLQDTHNVGPVMAFVSRAIAANANDVATGAAAALDIQHGTLEKSLKLMRSLQDIAPEQDMQKSTLASLLTRLASPHNDSGATPLDVIIDAIVAVNRAAPGQQSNAPLEAQDLRALLHETESFLASKRHGLERLYDVVQSRKLP